MLPLNQAGYVTEGAFKGWWVQIQESEGVGFIVIKALDSGMNDTKLFQGPFADMAGVEHYFHKHQLQVDWKD
ncbi:MAG: hypothetical protein U0P81_10705 [Holophagaceae bacterium]